MHQSYLTFQGHYRQIYQTLEIISYCRALSAGRVEWLALFPMRMVTTANVIILIRIWVVGALISTQVLSI